MKVHDRGNKYSRKAPYFIKIDNVQLFTGDTVKEPALFIQKDDLERLEFLGKLTRCDIGVDVEYLPIGTLSQTGKNGQCASADGCLDRTFINARDFANETILLSVEVVGGEDARSDGPGPRAQLLQCRNNFQVLVQKYSASNL